MGGVSSAANYCNSAVPKAAGSQAEWAEGSALIFHKIPSIHAVGIQLQQHAGIIHPLVSTSNKQKGEGRLTDRATVRVRVRLKYATESDVLSEERLLQSPAASLLMQTRHIKYGVLLQRLSGQVA